MLKHLSMSTRQSGFGQQVANKSNSECCARDFRVCRFDGPIPIYRKNQGEGEVESRWRGWVILST